MFPFNTKYINSFVRIMAPELNVCIIAKNEKTQTTHKDETKANPTTTVTLLQLSERKLRLLRVGVSICQLPHFTYCIEGIDGHFHYVDQYICNTKRAWA